MFKNARDTADLTGAPDASTVSIDDINHRHAHRIQRALFEQSTDAEKAFNAAAEEFESVAYAIKWHGARVMQAKQFDRDTELARRAFQAFKDGEIFMDGLVEVLDSSVGRVKTQLLTNTSGDMPQKYRDDGREGRSDAFEALEDACFHASEALAEAQSSQDD